MKGTAGVFILVSLLALGTGAEAKIVSAEVPYQHHDVTLTGYLAYDDAIEGKRPGVLVVHEWWGLNEYAKKRARQLAGLGYVAFAVDMYGQGKVTSHPQQASEWSQEITANITLWQERAAAGLDVLRKDPRVDPSRIGAVGYCFGGATVQQLAYSGADLQGVASFHGSPVPVKEGQAGQVKAKILILHGASDPLVKDAEIRSYIDAMEKSGLDWHMVIYGGARHSFTNPDADKAGMAPLKYSASADRRSWEHTTLFFNEAFSR